MQIPTRKIGIGYSGSLRGALPSSKADHVVRVESALERSLCLLLEFDPRVRYFCEQPVTIPYHPPGGSRGVRHYTPDFLIQYEDEVQAVLAEVKYQSELDAKAAELAPKFDAARHYAAEQGWAFRVFTEADILATPLLGNARLLLRFRTAPVPSCHTTALLDLLTRAQKSTPQDLITAGAYFTGAQPEELLPHCWHLLSCGRIGGDLTAAPLAMNTPLWSL
ncbi:TnsA endonuclease N-terminal domain-containing protein [Hymenobacter ruricola]|uniref:TnsA endonuclease N-terminal domain-containing protein n=1 Tax=Hymenobacter ruricola TaxID=2791023 RepID=A0ABS0I5D9_9BACT|nr:TnsA endonuclease N-terminal domain-containing protein [Hymenobacter ruricola]MBF9221774.1 TnsA endonuclease N-terminal domain-containing protein [Hymenobacter ruricola]